MMISTIWKANSCVEVGELYLPPSFSNLKTKTQVLILSLPHFITVLGSHNKNIHTPLNHQSCAAVVTMWRKRELQLSLWVIINKQERKQNTGKRLSKKKRFPHISKGILLSPHSVISSLCPTERHICSTVYEQHLKLSAVGRAVTSGLSGLDKRKSWLMSNSGDVAWRCRWGGWGLARIHTDKRGRQSEF